MLSRSADRAYALRYIVAHVCQGNNAKLLKDALLDFYKAGLFSPFTSFGRDTTYSHAGFGPSVVRDVAQLHGTVSAVEPAALAKDVFRWLQTNGGYLVEHPE